MHPTKQGQRHVIFSKPDLDTCLTALMLNVSIDDDLHHEPEGARPSELTDTGTICIEAGGSGDTDRNNFDHHDPLKNLPPASRQTFELLEKKSANLDRLVEYVCCIDEGLPLLNQIDGPSLSAIFSGMLLLEPDPQKQFTLGIDLLRIILDREFNPFGPMPHLDEWEPYLAEKNRNNLLLQNDLRNALFFTTRKGLKAGFLKTKAIGGSTSLYEQGCDVVVLYSDRSDHFAGAKFTIATRSINLTPLLETILQEEAGWGGRALIIGSPRNGTSLAPDLIIELAKKCL